jgi:two-component system OmpR family sensor kinase/two-component system sensor histidine kinase BaeS
MRRHFFRRVLTAFAIFFLFVLVVGWIGAALFHGGWQAGGHPGPRPFVPGFLLLLLVIAGFIGFGRAVRGTARPIGDVMDAASRVANGDYSARAPVYGPREVRELAESFNDMAARIEAGERQRRNLVADVSHELRTPLAVIQGRVEGIVDGVYPPDREHLELVLDQTTILARLLDDLLLLSKAEARALALEREPTPPRELVDAVVEAYRDEAAERRVRLEPRVSEGLSDVDVDRVRIGEVLSNLVTNALRYTPAGGSITVAASSAAAGGAGVAFEVADTGPGIPPEELPHVFDRFTKSPESRGSGLGLAIARSLVQAHGGSISAASDSVGTRIRFELPEA